MNEVTTTEQLELCKQHNVKPLIPTIDQMVVISEGVFEGDLTEGTRYPSPNHMSGWWITTDRYNGDSTSLRTEHLQHIVEKRSDLLKYLALPYGFRFFQRGYKENTEHVWFDQKVVESKE
jgi:hypothetical protein